MTPARRMPVDEGQRQRQRRTVEAALALIRERDDAYTGQLKSVLDAETYALLEALKMFHANSEKKLREYLRSLDL
jgi:hypothetical protein